MVAGQAVDAAKAQDNEEAAKAVRAGKPVPPAKHETKAKAAREDAERTLAAYQKALEGAQQDLNGYMAQHREAIYAALVEAVQRSDQELAHHAREAARRYAFREDAHYDLKALAPPPAPRDENAPAQRLSTSIIAIGTARSTGPARGEVEGILGYLAGLESPMGEPDSEEAGAA